MAADPNYPFTDFDVQSSDIARRRTLASLLQKQGMEGVQQPAKGVMHWTQTLGPAMAALMGTMQQNQLGKEEQTAAATKQQQMKDWMSSLPQGTPGQAAQPGSEMPPPELGGGPAQPATPAMLPKAADPTKMMQWAAQGSQFGGQAGKIADIAAASSMKNITDPYDKVGQDLYNRTTGEFIRSPVSIEEAKSKVQDRLDRNAVALQALADKKEKSEADRAQQAQIHADSNALRLQIAQMHASMSGGKQQLAGGTDAKGQPVMLGHDGSLSVVSDKGLVPYSGHIYKAGEEKILQAGATAAQGIADMKDILAQSQADPKIFGSRAAATSGIPTTMGMQAAASGLTPDQLAIRSKAASMTANTTHSMYGTAFSANEAKQAIGYLLQPGDTNIEVQRKLKGRIDLEMAHYKNLPAWERDAITARSPDLGAATSQGSGAAAQGAGWGQAQRM